MRVDRAHRWVRGWSIFSTRVGVVLYHLRKMSRTPNGAARQALERGRRTAAAATSHLVDLPKLSGPQNWQAFVEKSAARCNPRPAAAHNYLFPPSEDGSGSPVF